MQFSMAPNSATSYFIPGNWNRFSATLKKEIVNRGYKIEMEEENKELQTVSVVVSKWQ